MKCEEVRAHRPGGSDGDNSTNDKKKEMIGGKIWPEVNMRSDGGETSQQQLHEHVGEVRLRLRLRLG